jgi:hypothetical protein
MTKVLSHLSHDVRSFKLILQATDCTQKSFLGDDSKRFFKRLSGIEKVHLDIEIVSMVSTNSPLNP